MTKSDAKLTRLLNDVDKAKAEVERLFKEAIAKPHDKALHQLLWEAMESEGLARRLAVKYSGG
jgi:hypothetical protein